MGSEVVFRNLLYACSEDTYRQGGEPMFRFFLLLFTCLPLSLLVTANSVFGDEGTVWEKQEITGASYLQSVVHGNGLFVAVGGGIRFSEDGEIWNEGFLPLGAELAKVVFLRDRFYAVGRVHGAGMILKSLDGEFWSEEALPVGAVSAVTGIAEFQQGEEWITVAVGEEGLVLRAVDDGAWEIVSGMPEVSFSAVIAGDEGFVAAAATSVFHSSDGMVWDPVETGGSVAIEELLYFNGRYLARRISGSVGLSGDGRFWNFASFAEVGGLVCNDNFVFAIGDGVWMSADGGEWGATRGDGLDQSVRALAIGGSYAVALSVQGGVFRREIPWEPVITASPSVVGPVVAGGDLPLEVHAIGSGELTYQWYRDGAVLEGANGAELLLENLTVNDSGEYSVLVSNEASQAVSAEITVHVEATPPLFEENNVSLAWEQVEVGRRMPSVAYGSGRFVGISSPMPGFWHSRDGLGWSGSESGQLRYLHRVIYGGGKFIAVGQTHGGQEAVLYSEDGMTWAWANGPFILGELLSVSVGEGAFVAVGRQGVLWSEDGRNWERIAATPKLLTVAFGHGRFIGYDGGQMFSSENGRIWMLVDNVGFSSGGHHLVFENNHFFLCGSRNLDFLQSADGFFWTKRSLGGPGVQDLTFAGGMYVGLIEVGSQVYGSANEGSWKLRTGFSGGATNAIAAGGGRIVAAGNGKMSVRRDVIEPMVFQPPAVVGPVVAGGKLSLEVYGEGSGEISYQWFRDETALEADGPILELENLTAADSGHYSVTLQNAAGATTYRIADRIVVRPAPQRFGSDSSLRWENALNAPQQRLVSVAYGSGLFVAVSQLPGSLWHSRDGLSWSGGGTPQIYEFSRIIYGGGKFIAVGRRFRGGEETVLRSEDGMKWEWANLPSQTGLLTSVSYGGGVFVAVGEKGVLRSEDGKNWERVAGVPALATVAFGQGRFIGLAQGRNVFSSEDGHSWTQISSMDISISFWQPHLVFANDRFFVCDRGRSFLQSTDGVLWVNRGGKAEMIQDVVFAGEVYLGVGNSNGLIFGSADGGSWEKRLGVSKNFRAVASGGGRIVALGDGGVEVRPDVIEPIVFVPPTVVGPVVAGGSLSLEVYGEGSGEIVYRWWRDGVDLGVDESVLNLENLTVADSGQYSVVLENEGGSTAYPLGQITVLPAPPNYGLNNSLAWRRLADQPRRTSIAYGAGRFVAIGAGYGSATGLWHSADGLNWSLSDARQMRGLRRVIYGGGKFIAVGEARNGEETILYSEDGVNWGWANVLSETGSLTSASFGGGAFVAVGSQGVLWSEDGRDWERVGRTPLSTVAFGDGRFIGLEGRNVFSSEDGRSWAQVGITPSTPARPHLTFVNNHFFVCDAVGSLWSSVDGFFWTKRGPALTGMKDLTFAGETYVGLIGKSQVYGAMDAENWSFRSGMMTEFNGIASGGGRIVTVGETTVAVRRDVIEPMIVRSEVPERVTVQDGEVVRVEIPWIGTRDAGARFEWYLDGELFRETRESVFTLAEGELEENSTLSLRISNLGGTAVSGDIALRVIRSFEDWLEAAGMAAGTDPESAPDGSGIPLLLRYAMNLPLGENSRALLPRLTLETESVEGEEVRLAVFTFQRSRFLPDAELLVEISDDLESWNPLSMDEATVLVVPEGATELVTVKYPIPEGVTSPVFFRLRAERISDG